MKYSIYKHTTPEGKIYIGLTGDKPEYRWNNGKGYENNEAFFQAILTFGWSNIKHEILETTTTLEEAQEREAYYILHFRSHLSAYGYNVQSKRPANTITKKVFVCEETGEVYPTLKAAANAIGVCPSAISQSIARGGSSGGYHWHTEIMEV